MLFVLKTGQKLEAIAFIDSASRGILAMDFQSEQIYVLAGRLFLPDLFGQKLRFPDEMFQNLIGIPPFRIGGISTKLLVEAKLREVEQPGAFFPSGGGHVVSPEAAREPKPTMDSSASGFRYTQTFVLYFDMESSTSEPVIHSVAACAHGSSPQRRPARNGWSAAVNSSANRGRLCGFGSESDKAYFLFREGKTRVLTFARGRELAVSMDFACSSVSSRSTKKSFTESSIAATSMFGQRSVG